MKKARGTGWNSPRVWLALCLSLFPLTSIADTIPINLPHGAVGAITAATLPNGDKFPLKGEWLGASTGYYVVLEFTQTETFASGTYVAITPQSLLSANYNYPPSTRTFDFFAAYVAYATTEYKKFGTFKLVVDVHSGSPGGTIVESFTHEAHVEGIFSGSGGNLNLNDLNSQNSNQGSFWQGVLGPSQTAIDRWNAEVELWSQWGPLNVYSELVSAVGSLGEPDYDHCWVGCGEVAFSGGMKDGIRAVRFLVSVTLWIGAIAWVWRSFLRVVE